LLEGEMKVYDADATWADNGIVRNVGCSNHPWTCGFCNKEKKLGSLYECAQHCAAAGHQSALQWRRELMGRCIPDVPRWTGMWVDRPAHGRTCSMEESSTSGGTSSRAARLESTPRAAGQRELPSVAPEVARTRSVLLYNVTLNGEPIGGATLVVPISGPRVLPLDESCVLDEVKITGDVRPTNGSSAHGSSSFPPLKQQRAGGSGADDSSSSRSPVAGTASEAGPISSTCPCAVRVMIVASRQSPLPTPPRPAGFTLQDARQGGATTACAHFWRGSSRRLGDREADSSSADDSMSDSAGDPGRG